LPAAAGGRIRDTAVTMPKRLLAPEEPAGCEETSRQGMGRRREERLLGQGAIVCRVTLQRRTREKLTRLY
jgi:hypothetical protein